MDARDKPGHDGRRLIGFFGCLLALALSVASARADVDTGKQYFKRYCSVCHSLEAGKNKFGPSLSAVVGRKIASIPGYDYSEAFRKLEGEWTPARLDEYLTGPPKFAPGTKMMFPGVANADDRHSLVEFLGTVRD